MANWEDSKVKEPCELKMTPNFLETVNVAGKTVTQTLMLLPSCILRYESGMPECQLAVRNHTQVWRYANSSSV